MGETILIHGASGAVGLASVQLAKYLGLTVLGTAGTIEGLQLLKEQGADHVFNHKNEDHCNQIKNLIPNGVNMIVEMLANVNLGNDLPLLAHGGRVLLVGSRGEVVINPRDAMSKESTIQGVQLFTTRPEEYKASKEFLLKGINDGWVKPVIGKEYPMNKVQEAHQEIIYGSGTKGRMVLNLDLN